MGNEADKKFTWVIKNFSSYRSESVYSDIFVAGRCKWRLLAYPKGHKLYDDSLSLLTEILCKSHGKLSNSDLADAYSSLTYETKAGFKIDWLEKALKEAGETRIQEIEEELNDLTQKRADMEALLKFLK
ncbi:hypothetical protein Bca52824_012727 [Brassica carinata]|uniref:MATH domain-containing protein n=1 Tax=Brassica carinata TaxID=52824 RepID=A0A8X7VWZ6_BRACI|nr:hypothetical protein Bca52824_012727 [Brassica carinata]